MNDLKADIPERAANTIEGMLAGKTLQEAALDADAKNTRTQVTKFFERRATRKYIRSHIQGRLECEGAPAAYHYLLAVLRDNTERYDARLKIDVAKFLITTAGYVPPKALDGDKPRDSRAPSEMTHAELRATLDSLEEELGIRAKAIEAPIPDAEVEPDHSSIL